MFDRNGFEIQTCTRCGGSGNYSYCQMYGTVCFKCAGKKVCFTAKGYAAAKFYTDSLLVPLGSLAIGDLLQIDSYFQGVKYFAPITAIKPSTSMRILPDGSKESLGLEVSTEHPKYGKSGLVSSPESLVRKGWGKTVKAEKLAAAIAYQNMLTKTGKLRKAAA